MRFKRYFMLHITFFFGLTRRYWICRHLSISPPSRVQTSWRPKHSSFHPEKKKKKRQKMIIVYFDRLLLTRINRGFRFAKQSRLFIAIIPLVFAQNINTESWKQAPLTLFTSKRAKNKNSRKIPNFNLENIEKQMVPCKSTDEWINGHTTELFFHRLKS